MNISDIIVGSHVLVQSKPNVKEHAIVKGVDPKSGYAIVILSDGHITRINPEFIIKTFQE